MKKIIILLLLGICQSAFSQVCGNVGITSGAALSQNSGGAMCGVFASAEFKWLRFEVECGWSQVDCRPKQEDTRHDNILYLNPSIGMVIGDECRITLLLGVTNWGGTDKEQQLSKMLICPKIKIGGEVPLAPLVYLNISWNGIVTPSTDVAIYTNNLLTVSVGYRF